MPLDAVSGIDRYLYDSALQYLAPHKDITELKRLYCLADAYDPNFEVELNSLISRLCFIHSTGTESFPNLKIIRRVLNQICKNVFDTDYGDDLSGVVEAVIKTLGGRKHDSLERFYQGCNAQNSDAFSLLSLPDIQEFIEKHHGMDRVYIAAFLGSDPYQTRAIIRTCDTDTLGTYEYYYIRHSIGRNGNASMLTITPFSKDVL